MKPPDHWTRQRLSDLISIRHGYAFSSAHFNSDGDGERLLTPGNFFAEGGFRDSGDKQKYFSGSVPPEYRLNGGSLVCVMTEQAPGLLGSTARLPSSTRYLHNQRIGLINVHDTSTHDAGFVYHLLNWQEVRREVATSAAGTKVRHTSPDRIGRIKVPVPPLPEQRYIASALDLWDAACDAIDQLARYKGERLRGLTQQLLTGRRRLPAFADQPWDEVHIGDVGAETSERCGERDDITVLSCTKTVGLVDSLEYFGRQVFGEDLSNYKIVHRGEFVYATNHIEEGSIGLLIHRNRGLVSPMYTVFKPNNRVDPRFLYKLLKTERYRQKFQAWTSASVDRRGGLRWSEFAAIKIPLPPLDEQRAIADVLDTAEKEIDLLAALREQIQQQKRGLMQKLLTGQIQVPISGELAHVAE